LAALAQPLIQPLDLAPGPVAGRRRVPRAAVALHGRQRGLRALGPLALRQLGDRQATELLGEHAQTAAVVATVAVHVAGNVQRRSRPEDALDHAALEPN